MSLKFAIVEKDKESRLSEAVPGYTEGQFLCRLRAKLNEKFLLKENYYKRFFTRAQCLDLSDMAYKECVADLKEETVSVP